MTRIPWRILGYIAAALIALAAFNYGMGFIPGTEQWRGKRHAAENVRLRGQVSTLEREATGNAEIQTATETLHTQTVVIREVTAAAIAEARSEPDADTPLPQSRADRLRAHDRSLCDNQPAICTNADPSGSGDNAL